MKKVLIAIALTGFGMLSAQSAHAALNAYLQLKSSQIAKFNQATASGWYNALCTNEAISSIVSPRDPASGQATGKRTHKPFRVRMYYDQATQGSALLSAFSSKGTLQGATILLHRPVGSGKEQVYLSLKLEKVRITSYQLGVMDGRPALTIELMFDSMKHQAVSKTVNAAAWMTDVNFGGA